MVAERGDGSSDGASKAMSLVMSDVWQQLKTKFAAAVTTGTFDSASPGDLKSLVTAIDLIMSTAQELSQAQAGKLSSEFKKSALDFKSVSNLKMIPSDKTQFRQWNHKCKVALSQVSPEYEGNMSCIGKVLGIAESNNVID